MHSMQNISKQTFCVSHFWCITIILFSVQVVILGATGTEGTIEVFVALQGFSICVLLMGTSMVHCKIQPLGYN